MTAGALRNILFGLEGSSDLSKTLNLIWELTSAAAKWMQS